MLGPTQYRAMRNPWVSWRESRMRPGLYTIRHSGRWDKRISVGGTGAALRRARSGDHEPPVGAGRADDRARDRRRVAARAADRLHHRDDGDEHPVQEGLAAAPPRRARLPV